MVFKVPALLLLLFVVDALCANSSPLFKVFSQGTPIYRGRADSIVNPGAISHHSHKVFGASGFSLSSASKTPLEVYDDMFASNCTTMTITVDKSAYWIPDLYYQYPDGNLTLVPNGGLTVYYFGRRGNGAQSFPDWKPFPKGFRMIAGNPFRRSTTGIVSEKALQWACLSTSPAPETQELPTATRFCNNGLRAQVFFPQCWDGINLDSPNHKDHVAYPSAYNTGDCPSSHPVRLPAVFYEILFSVSKFPHGEGRQPFVLACGDPTGYGLHGDFLNGWDTTILQAAMKDVSCYANNTNNGNRPRNCLPLQPYVKDDNDDLSCLIDTPILNYEDLGYNHNISHLPGNNPISYGPETFTPVFGSYQQVISQGYYRTFIKSNSTGKYLSVINQELPVNVDSLQSGLNYRQVFLLIPLDGVAGKFALQTEATGQYVSTDSSNGGKPLRANRNSPSNWESWQLSVTPTGDGALGSIRSYSNNKYVSLNVATGQLFATGTKVEANELFNFIDANANVPDTRNPPVN